MKVLQRSRRLARLAGCAALTVGLAGTAVAGSPPAQARVTWPTVDRHVAVSWGSNGSSTPVQVTGLTGVTQVAAGGLHSLALRSDGTVWAWGYNFVGQLGNGTQTGSGTPVQVTGLTGVIQVAAGGLHSLALRSDGTVWTWGDGGTGLAYLTPVQVTGLTGVTKIS